MATVDSQLRAVLTQSGVEERVEVNQRHLIDKILARYSAEFTVFRELIQNSNDAMAKCVDICFQAAAATPPSTISSLMTSVVYRNDGRPFGEDDWRRLKSIAEGNPDDTKIGYFGVGFYSLFSVSSGDACLGFFWKGDQLYCKRASIPDSISADERKWTTFSMQLREPMEIPNSVEFARFLATSLSFTDSLQQVKVTRNNEITININKASAPPRELDIPRHLHLESPNRLFKLQSVELRQVQMDAEILIEEQPVKEQSSFRFFSLFNNNIPKPTPELRIERVTASLFFRIARGRMNVTLQEKMASQMERTTKKRAPIKTSIQMIYNNYDEWDASLKMKTKCEVFNDLVPFPEQGRIFIGFPTHQTTGCSIHLAGHLIPTVERENIDFVDPTLNVWNQEILSMGGLLARFTYDSELDSVSQLYTTVMGNRVDSTKDPVSEEESQWLTSKCIHILKSFSFRNSTPAALVQQAIATHFFRCSRQDLSIYSTRGILPATQVRMPSPEVKSFIKTTPILSDAVAKECPDYVKLLRRAGMLKDISIEDILIEISGRQLSLDETVAVAQWWATCSRNQEISAMYNVSFRQAFKVPCGVPEQWVQLSTSNQYANAKIFPPEVPVPINVVSMLLSKNLNDNVLNTLGLSEYEIIDWVQHVIKDVQMTQDSEFSQRIFNVLSRALPHMNAQTKAVLASVFAEHACVPTTRGMHKPSEAYFGNVTLFSDLPVVKFPKTHSVSDKLLALIGVREHVDLQMVFDRLDTLQWDHQHLLKYLASVQAKLSDSEIHKLKAATIFPAQSRPNIPNTMRFRAADLYVPTDELKSYNVPLLDMGGRHWRANLPESQLLLKLGIQTYLSLDMIIDQCSNPENKLADKVKLLIYFGTHFDNYQSIYSASKVLRRFVPNVQGSISRPIELFSDKDCSAMGFDILVDELRPYAEKIGVRVHPSGAELLKRLLDRPPTSETASTVFAFLAGKQREFSRTEFTKLRTTKFVPVRKDGRTVVYAEPGKVFFAGGEGEGNAAAFIWLFDYVDFGATGNLFLRACGVKDEPSPVELAQLLVSDQQHQLFEQANVEQYLDLLRKLAVNWNVLAAQPSLLAQMKRAKFLIGITVVTETKAIDTKADIKSETNKNAKEAKAAVLGPDSVKESPDNCRLAQASEIYLIDDPILQNIFRPLSAPVDPLLEGMYEALGSQWISASVQSRYRAIGKVITTTNSISLEKLLRERGPLLIYDAGSISSNVLSVAPKILSSIQVVQADSIEIVRRFRDKTDTQLTSACLTKGGDMFGANSAYTMVVSSGDVDYFDVARGLADVLFRKPKLNDALLISTMLSTTLDSLRRKGFPVDRILKTASPIKPKLQVTPVAPPVTPNIKTSTPVNASESTLLSSSSRTENKPTNVESNQINSPITPTITKSAQRPNLMRQQDQESQGKNVAQEPKRNNDRTGISEIDPSFKANLKKDLLSSISSCAPNNQDVIQSSSSVTTLSQSTYCDLRHAHDLAYYSTIDGVQLYMDPETRATNIVNEKILGFRSFAALLKLVAGVYGVSESGVYIYYDTSAETVAFNKQRTLFFNARFYLSLHWSASGGTAALPIKSEAYTYWFMVFAHELAHNQAPNHDSRHEFYMSSYADTFMVKLMVTLLGMGVDLAT